MSRVLKGACRLLTEFKRQGGTWQFLGHLLRYFHFLAGLTEEMK